MPLFLDRIKTTSFNSVHTKGLFSLHQKQKMKLIVALAILLASLNTTAQDGRQIKLCKGNWVASLALNDAHKLPFNFVVTKETSGYSFSVKNGEEVIMLNKPVRRGDSLYVRFPFFNSELVFAVNSRKSIEGYWVNYNKGSDYKIPFQSTKKRFDLFSFASKKKPKNTIGGKWEVTFQPNTNEVYPALGIFNQDEKINSISGTFLTETGDYRFLQGNIINDSLYLSCFDGSHAFLFKSAIDNDSLHGTFYSGSHWSSSWNARRNENFELKSPDELTYIVDDKKVEFNLKDVAGNPYLFPNHETYDKVVILQVMGTWCPNCLDETMYYKDLYNMYHQQGLEIVSIGYEVGDTFEEHSASIKRLANKLGLDFTFLVGGSATKRLASEHFDMLNQVISFPTSIFIGRDGEVKRVHTGFNGPGTGDYYKKYVENTNSLIQKLLAE